MNKTLFPSYKQQEEPSLMENAPLAERMRPQTLDDVLGQEHLLGKGKFLREIISNDELPSMIFWGPPGVGKTTLARIISQHTKSVFLSISAVLSGVKDVKEIVKEARQYQNHDRRTVLFVDEIHRFNKAQQDAFLPHLEGGTLTLIGATTENPSFEVIAPLLSRSKVLILKPLQANQLLKLLIRALADSRWGLGKWNLDTKDKVLEQIALSCNGDARIALNTLEIAAQLARRKNSTHPTISRQVAAEAMQKGTLVYDKTGEEHFNLISALHKSLRNSDADAALYWLGRMLEAGEDPLYIARRMVRFASEDVGLADPIALSYSMDTVQAVRFLGLPEGNLALAQLAVYLAQTPKSNAIYRAYSRVQKDIEKKRNEPVPLHLRNAPTPLMQKLGYGSGYRYAHNEPDRLADMLCLPESLKERCYYEPTNSGQEKTIAERLDLIRKIRRRRKEQESK